eukprot:6213109-Pleurochrysis_carterae.AAC.10
MSLAQQQQYAELFLRDERLLFRAAMEGRLCDCSLRSLAWRYFLTSLPRARPAFSNESQMEVFAHRVQERRRPVSIRLSMRGSISTHSPRLSVLHLLREFALLRGALFVVAPPHCRGGRPRSCKAAQRRAADARTRG